MADMHARQVREWRATSKSFIFKAVHHIYTERLTNHPQSDISDQAETGPSARLTKQRRDAHVNAAPNCMQAKLKCIPRRYCKGIVALTI